MQEVSISSFLIQVAHRGEKDYFTHFPYHGKGVGKMCQGVFYWLRL